MIPVAPPIRFELQTETYPSRTYPRELYIAFVGRQSVGEFSVVQKSSLDFDVCMDFNAETTREAFKKVFNISQEKAIKISEEFLREEWNELWKKYHTPLREGSDGLSPSILPIRFGFEKKTSYGRNEFMAYVGSVVVGCYSVSTERFGFHVCAESYLTFDTFKRAEHASQETVIGIAEDFLREEWVKYWKGLQDSLEEKL